MTDYKNQHFVTEAYLKAWLDPNTPQGAYVWITSKQEKKLFKKAPKKLFAEEDFYTVYDSKGNRILEVEHKLKEIEDKFILLRDNKLQNHQPLTPEDRKTIALFASTMFARTKRQKEEGKQIWEEYIAFIETIPPELSSIIKQTEEYKQVEKLHKKQPMPYHLFHFVNMTAPYLYLMNCAIYETDIKPGLITSDNPCLWVDPTIFDAAMPLTFFGLGSPKLNIILPISPKQYISLERNGPDGYTRLIDSAEIEENIIDPLNALIVASSDEFIIVSRKTLKDGWFNISNN